MILEATSRVFASSANLSANISHTFSSASDISRMLSGSKACPARYGRIGMIALHRCRIRREGASCLSVCQSPTPRGLLACFSVGDVQLSPPPPTAPNEAPMNGSGSKPPTRQHGLLERAIERSKRPPPPAALAPPQHSAEEVKGPFVTRRRNLR